ncbi:hypothetical protein Gotri_012883 [Gossypium trilobum]|uniref:Uncharacterized protein n=1 Tax=Gossypium trilobum TaxID=34281 RepID=A0A7J9DSA5_9ROSI|nr:hypothetical protein [Gossypium trilobum]
MAVIEGNEISNARDTTYERPNPEEDECLDDIECNHCKIKLAKNKDGTTIQYKIHLDGCVKRQTWTYDQAKIKEVVSYMIMIHEFLLAFTKYELFILFMKTASAHYVRLFRAIPKVDCWTSYEVEKKC